MDVRRSSRKWVVFHETFTFCLPTWAEVALDVEWKYRYRVFRAQYGNTMIMEPGEIHANLQETPVADFIVVQIQPSVMLKTAAELGWPHRELHIKVSHSETRHPAVIAALRAFNNALCTRYADNKPPSRRRGCTCLESAAEHRENLAQLVQVVIDNCAEASAGARKPAAGGALLRRAEAFIRESYREPYSLPGLLAATGCKAPSTLLHSFKQEVGVTPSAFVQKMRIAEACWRLVSDPTAPLDIVASEVGFGDRNGGALLVRHFRRTLGTTPGAFRAALRSLPLDARRDFARIVLSRG